MAYVAFAPIPVTFTYRLARVVQLQDRDELLKYRPLTVCGIWPVEQVQCALHSAIFDDHE